METARNGIAVKLAEEMKSGKEETKLANVVLGMIKSPGQHCVPVRRGPTRVVCAVTNAERSFSTAISACVPKVGRSF